MAKQSHIVDNDYRVWRVTGKCLDNGNVVTNYVWGDNADLARTYLLNHDLSYANCGTTIQFTATVPITDGTYDQTVNCFYNDPDRYNRYYAQFGPE